jgi:class 3 adenylate cyclase/tetratricopeptide (TPR) repeat protein
MRCSRCQHDNPPGSKFCLECGARLTLRYPSCDATLPGGAKFCNECGSPVAGSAPTAAPRFGSPDSYTPRHLAEKILTSKAALEGERKQVTVLFADLKGSMELLAERDPEDARGVLDPVLDRMMDAVHRYEGTVNQVMGDGIMALFGAPVAHEDHAVRACYAALDMQAAIRRHAEEARRTHGLGGVAIRVGLNSGEVVVRAVGSDLRMDYTAVGQTTHLAARMEQLADPGTTVLKAGTLRLAEGFIAVKPLGPVPVKGLEAPVEIYELTGAGPLRSRLHAAAARGLTRFVGRESELEQLRQALSRAAGGHGQVVAIVGEPGVGKSRLVWEVTHSHRTHGWLIAQAGSVSYGKATPYLPVMDLLKGYFQIEDRDDHRKIQEKVTGKLLTLDEALKPALPAVLALLDVPVEDAAWQALDPPQRRRRTLDAVKRLLLRETQVQPLLVVFEDLHWIDSETQALLDSLVESVPTTRLLLLANYRPEYGHRWGGKTYYTQLRLDPLPPESATDLLDALLGPELALNPLKQLLIERTEGNPFFLEETVRTLVETAVLAGERGAYRSARPLGAIQVPATVQAVLAARIDRLPPEEKTLLQTASVIGKDVPLALLHAVADTPEADVRSRLADLQAAEFLHEARLFPDPEYTFKHALTHEVAYDSLLQARRRTLHSRIVKAVEQLYPDRLAECAELLAQHAFQSEVWDKAVIYCRLAGDKAFERSANRQAVELFERALAALEHLPDTPDRLEAGIDLRFSLRNSLWALAEVGTLLDHLREAEAVAGALGDQLRLGRVLAYTAAVLLVTGEHSPALESGKRALTIAATVEDFPLQIVARFYLGMTYYALGDYRRGVDVLRNNVHSLRGELAYERLGMGGLPSVVSRHWLGWCLAELGQFAEATACAEDAITIGERANQPYTLVAALSSGRVYLHKGDLPKAIAILERGMALGREWNFLLFSGWLASSLGGAYVLAGRAAEALPFVKEAIEQTVARNMLSLHSLLLATLSEAYLGTGQLDEAVKVARRALEVADERQERGNQAHCLRLLGEIASHREPPEVEQAETHYRGAWALAHELGMRPLMAHCHLGFGKLYRRVGRSDLAREQLTTAATLYRELEMTFYLAQAEAALREVG